MRKVRTLYYEKLNLCRNCTSATEATKHSKTTTSSHLSLSTTITLIQTRHPLIPLSYTDRHRTAQSQQISARAVRKQFLPKKLAGYVLLKNSYRGISTDSTGHKLDAQDDKAKCNKVWTAICQVINSIYHHGCWTR